MDLAQAPAIELFLGLLLAADRVPEVGHDNQQKEHHRRSRQRYDFERMSGVHGVIRTVGDHGRLQDLQHDIAHDRIGHHIMLLQQHLHDLERQRRILCRDLNGQQIGRLNGRGIDAHGKLLHPKLPEDVLAHDGAVEDLRKYGGQGGCGIKIVIDRRSTVPGGQDQGAVCGIVGDIAAVCVDERDHAGDQRHDNDQQPLPCSVADQHDRVKGHQRFLIWIQFFFLFFLLHFRPPVTPRRQTASQCLNMSSNWNSG